MDGAPAPDRCSDVLLGCFFGYKASYPHQTAPISQAIIDKSTAVESEYLALHFKPFGRLKSGVLEGRFGDSAWGLTI